jgi:hypothetical protein
MSYHDGVAVALDVFSTDQIEIQVKNEISEL